MIIDQAAERRTKSRPAANNPRKNNEPLNRNVPQDVLEAIRWHIAQGYAGRQLLFCDDPALPPYIDTTTARYGPSTVR